MGGGYDNICLSNPMPADTDRGQIFAVSEDSLTDGAASKFAQLILSLDCKKIYMKSKGEEVT